MGAGDQITLSTFSAEQLAEEAFGEELAGPTLELTVVGVGPDLDGALKRAYDAIGAVQFNGMSYRKDIGFRALKKPVNR